MNESYEEGRKHGFIEAEAYAHFDVMYSGFVKTERLHQWVCEHYTPEVAQVIFPLPKAEDEWRP